MNLVSSSLSAIEARLAALESQVQYVEDVVVGGDGLNKQMADPNTRTKTCDLSDPTDWYDRTLQWEHLYQPFHEFELKTVSHVYWTGSALWYTYDLLRIKAGRIVGIRYGKVGIADECQNTLIVTAIDCTELRNPICG